MTNDINKELDKVYLNRIYGADNSIIKLIFDAFVSDSYPRWLSMKPAILENKLEVAASIIHGIKPSFAMAGMTWLKPRIEEMELEIKAGSSTEVLMEYYNEINSEMDRLIPILISESEQIED